jgi:4-hydroxy-3-polyprenylbenzoate decarboxylase
MSCKDLREFINLLEKKNLLLRIKEEVNPILEITEITDRIVKKGGQALYFEKVIESKLPAVTNLFGTHQRMVLALGVENFEEITQRITELLHPKTPSSFMEKVRFLPKLLELSNISPKLIKNAPCQEIIINDPSLYILPILKCWPEDGGKFITLPMVITKDPDNGVRNMGMYRMQVFDEKTTGMHWHAHKDGARHFQKYKKLNKKMGVAVALGGDPATIYSATAPVPAEIDEFLFAGFLRREPVEIVKCKTMDLEVPAHAEIILEGFVDPNETKIEGPFGDHTGFYSPADNYPVFHLTCITHRKNPIYPATIVGKPPMEDCFMAKATERIFLPLLKIIFPEIVDIALPIEGVFHNCAIVSIKKIYPGQARKTAHGLWGTGQMMFTKIIIIVEDDVDVQNISEVAWKVFNNIDPKRDVFFTEGPVDILNHAVHTTGVGSKMGIDATKKSKEEGFDGNWPKEIKMDEKIKRIIEEKLGKFC